MGDDGRELGVDVRYDNHDLGPIRAQVVPGNAEDHHEADRRTTMHHLRP